MNQEQSMSDTKAAKSRTIQLCVRFDEHDVELLKTLCREEKQGRRDAIQSLAFRLEASLLSESDDRTGHADDEVSALQELQAENERLTGVCKEFDTLVSRLSRSLSATEKANAKLREAAESAAKDLESSAEPFDRACVALRDSAGMPVLQPSPWRDVATDPPTKAFDARTAKAESRWEISDGSVWTFLRRCNNGEALFLNFYGVERFTNVSGDGRSDGIHVIGPAADQPSPPYTVS